jgi:hypothetical protein
MIGQIDDPHRTTSIRQVRKGPGQISMDVVAKADLFLQDRMREQNAGERFGCRSNLIDRLSRWRALRFLIDKPIVIRIGFPIFQYPDGKPDVLWLVDKRKSIPVGSKTGRYPRFI